MRLEYFAFCLLLFLNSPHLMRSQSERFWTFMCKENSCRSAFLRSIYLNCYGIQCKAIIDEHFSSCSSCANELLDGSHHLLMDGQSYLICAPEDELQVLGCQFKCRANYQPNGRCLRKNNVPVCECSLGEESNETTTTTTTTTTAEPEVEQIPFGTLKRTLTGHNDSVWSLAALRDGTLASSSKDSTVRVWDVERDEPLLHVLRGHSSFVWKVIELPDGNIASGGFDKNIHVWDPREGRLLYELELSYPVESLTVLANGLLVSSELWHVCLWNQTEYLTKFRVDAISVYLVLGLKNGDLAVGGSGINMEIKIYDPETTLLKSSLKGHNQTVWSLIELDNGDLVSSSSDGTIKIWDADTGVIKRSIQASEKQVRSIAVLPNGYLASGSTDHTIKIWDMLTGELKQTLEGHSDWVISLAVLKNGDLASASADNTIKIWHTRLSV